jgi:hypothetical protein
VKWTNDTMGSEPSRPKFYQIAIGKIGSPASSTTKTGRHDIAESGVEHNKSNKIIFKILLFSSPDPKGHVRYCHQPWASNW